MAGKGLSIRQKQNSNVRFPTQLTKDSVLGAALVLLPRRVEKISEVLQDLHKSCTCRRTEETYI